MPPLSLPPGLLLIFTAAPPSFTALLLLALLFILLLLFSFPLPSFTSSFPSFPSFPSSFPTASFPSPLCPSLFFFFVFSLLGIRPALILLSFSLSLLSSSLLSASLLSLSSHSSFALRCPSPLKCAPSSS
jgi:hypothetical protein